MGHWWLLAVCGFGSFRMSYHCGFWLTSEFLERFWELMIGGGRFGEVVEVDEGIKN